MGRAAPASEAKLILGRYRPVRPLGSGGSGSVWLAHDERSGRDVALKIVAREGNAGTRAEREAATAARLRHKRCIRALTLSRDDEHVYIAYEYVPGRTLRDVLRARELTDRAAIQIAVQILDGLAHAHAQGIVHRDVKPSNVLLRDGHSVSAFLLDFGLALIREEDTLTAVGDVPGTLAYISPERLRGRTATPAADVWSVGVLLWEALAGKHPFWKASVLDTARAIQSGAPSLAKVRPDLPKRLTALVDRALSREPAKRPSAAKLAAGLRRNPARSRRRPPIRLPGMPDLANALPALAAGLFALYAAAALPFFPHGWPLGLASLAALATAVRPRAGVALALAVPILPLGNIALGLALAYTAVALVWFACSWHRPREALTFVVGPLLAPLGGLALLPLALERVTGHARRAVLTALGVLAAAVVSGLDGHPLPFTSDPRPKALHLHETTHPLTAAGQIRGALVREPALFRLTLVLAVAAAAAPLLRGRGLWPIALYGASLVAAGLIPTATVDPLPLVVSVWVTCGFVAARELGWSPKALVRTRLGEPQHGH